MGCVSTSATPLTGTLLCNLGPSRLKMVEFLLSRGADPNSPGKTWTPVMVAAHNHDAGALILLLAAGGDVNLANTENRNKTAIHYCVDNFFNFGSARRVAYEQTAFLLDQAGADLDKVSDDGTPLYRSVQFRVYRMMKYLLFANCSLEPQEFEEGPEPLSRRHRTPLRMAVLKGDSYAVDLLLAAGCRVDSESLNVARSAIEDQQQQQSTGPGGPGPGPGPPPTPPDAASETAEEIVAKLAQHQLRSLRDDSVIAIKRRLRRGGHSGAFRFAAAVDSLPVPEIVKDLLLPLEVQVYLDSLGVEQSELFDAR